MAASAAEGRKIVLGLYREILRLHREKLPPPLRSVGDKYVATEFKAVSTNKNTTQAHWREFVEQWTLYTKTLKGQLGVESAAEEEWASRRLAELTPEQRERLGKLQEEAERKTQEESRDPGAG